MSENVLLIYRELPRAQPYAAALSAAGVDAELVSADTPITLDGFSGLVLMGGSDVDPDLYGESAHPKTDPPNICPTHVTKKDPHDLTFGGGL